MIIYRNSLQNQPYSLSPTLQPVDRSQNTCRKEIAEIKGILSVKMNLKILIKNIISSYTLSVTVIRIYLNNILWIKFEI